MRRTRTSQYSCMQMQKSAVVVLVQCCGNVFWSVHRGCARACARARACGCELRRCCRMGPAPQDAAHRLCRPLGRRSGPALVRTDPPAIEALFHKSFFFFRVRLKEKGYSTGYLLCMYTMLLSAERSCILRFALSQVSVCVSVCVCVCVCV